MYTIAGTGHRPAKLFPRGKAYTKEAPELLEKFAWAFLNKHKASIARMISGGAIGWDQALAGAALRLEIPLTLAIPFEGQESKWPESSKVQYRYLREKADNVVIVSDGEYAPFKMQVRNEWMVNHCDIVLALWDGSTGGTANCVAYARKVGKEIINTWDTWRKFLQMDGITK